MNNVSNTRNKFKYFITQICISLICIFFVPTASADWWDDHRTRTSPTPNAPSSMGGSGHQPPPNVTGPNGPQGAGSGSQPPGAPEPKGVGGSGGGDLPPAPPI